MPTNAFNPKFALATSLLFSYSFFFFHINLKIEFIILWLQNQFQGFYCLFVIYFKKISIVVSLLLVLFAASLPTSVIICLAFYSEFGNIVLCLRLVSLNHPYRNHVKLFLSIPYQYIFFQKGTCRSMCYHFQLKFLIFSVHLSLHNIRK